MRNVARKYIASSEAIKPVLDALREALGIELGEFGLHRLQITLETGKPVEIEARGFVRGEQSKADDFVEVIQVGQ